ncbi:MAG: hypothetical protein EZS28_001542 [Streblomastix strix]|uniref:Uncharacterized protein n=1 Tax=Streblomastix strix TaxID=222440 RepID=A0A5J4X7C6_9EUKA|nr:MAG: hypothetical protein EZS28_001542 [Streblomastix strix]
MLNKILSCYKRKLSINKEEDQQCLLLRDQYELVGIRYSRVVAISISTAGGSGEEQDHEIWNGLICIANFLSQLRQGRNYHPFYPSFPPQPELAYGSEEQFEEEGGNEEVESQLFNKGQNGRIMDEATRTIGWKLSYFIDSSNNRPFWYYL